MQIIKTKTLTAVQEDRIDGLWDEEYPQNLAGRYRLLLDGVDNYGHHLLLDEAGAIAGWAVEFEKDGETRFSIIVPSALQSKGYGRMLLDSLKAGLDEFYGWVIDHDRDVKTNGVPYRTPLPFYLKNGFELLADQRIEADIISAVKIKWSRPAESSGTHVYNGAKQYSARNGATDSLNIRTLKNIATQELVACFNLAFSDYVVPLQVEAGPFSEGLRQRGICMDLSAGAFDGDRLVGFILTCLDTVGHIRTAYNAGTGVAPGYRGRGLTKRMYHFLLPLWQEQHVEECALEVVEENAAAVRVHQSLGYVRSRLLRCYKGRIAAINRKEDTEVKLLANIDEQQWQGFWDWQPTWQNGLPTIRRSLSDLTLLGAISNEQLVGYLVYNPLQKRVQQFAVDKAYRRRGIGRQLFRFIAEQYDAEITLINVDGAAVETDAFVQSLGLIQYASQIDMKLRLAPSLETGQVRFIHE